jgi:HlyD family secretion protein
MQYSFLSLAISLVLISGCGNKQETEHPQKRSITEVVYASGNLYPENEYKLFANTSGYLSEVYVSEGDSVSLNQELFLIDVPNRNSESDASALAFRLAQLNSASDSPVIGQLTERLKAAKLKAQTDSVNLVRYLNLATTGAISLSDVDRVRTQAEASKRDANALSDQIIVQKRSLELEAANARNRLNQAKNNQGDGLLKSLLTGKIYEVYKQKGDYIHQNEAIALLGDYASPIARLSIDESDYELIKMQQEVLITLDAYPNKIFKARITKVYPKLNKAEQAFKVDARFVDEAPTGMYGLNLEANIIIRKTQDVLTIPRSALMNQDSVRIIRKGEKMTVKIDKGASDLISVEVIAGIQESDELIITN